MGFLCLTRVPVSERLSEVRGTQSVLWKHSRLIRLIMTFWPSRQGEVDRCSNEYHMEHKVFYLSRINILFIIVNPDGLTRIGRSTHHSKNKHSPFFRFCFLAWYGVPIIVTPYVIFWSKMDILSCIGIIFFRFPL
jgi:hypothetical protein